MKNKLLLALLLAGISAAPLLSSAQGFIGNGTSNGIKAVNSSGTLSGVNVGVGLATPAAGTTLEVADPSGSSLGLRFDNLPSTSTPYVLYYDGSATVTYGPAPSGGVSTVDYDCGIGTVTVNGVTSTNKAWLLSGATTAPASYFGTFNNDDIRIATNNANCAIDPLKQKMIIAKDGSVGIGYDGTNAPTYPQNKLLVENGSPLPGLNANLSAFFGSPQNIGVVVAGNSANSDNISYASVIQKNSAPNNIGYASLVFGDNSKNQGFGVYVVGDNSNNIGYEGEVGSGNVNSYNIEYQANTGIDAITSNNIALNARVGHGSTGCTNIGIADTIYGDGGADHTGMLMRVEGTPTITRGIFCDIATSGSTDVSGLQVNLLSGSDGSSTNYGVKSDLSAGAPVSGGSVPYYAVYGIAPTGTASGSGASNGSNAYKAYAGYFEGDVFCSNNYYYSDPKLKENITTYSGALDQLGKIPVKRYTFRNSEYPKMNLPQGDQIGVLTTDLKAVFPNLVKSAKHPANGKGDQSVDFEAVNYNALIPVLIQAVKELDAKPVDKDLAKTVADQQAQIAAQSQQITELRSLLDELCTNGCAGFNPKGNVQAAPIQGASLYQSIPNPASGTVSIGYSITLPYTTAAISVVTMEGKQLAEYRINTQGNGSVSFDAGSLAAGVYKYYLTIDGRVIDTKSMAIATK